MSGLFSTGLFTLELRRATWRVLLPTVVFVALVLRVRPEPAPGPLGELAAGSLARGLFRQDVWTATLFFLAPLAVFHAARVPARWRAGEGDWIGARPVARGAAVAGSWSGLALAVLAALGLSALWIEARAARGVPAGEGETSVLVGSYPLAEVRRIEPGATLELDLDPLRLAAAAARAGGRPLRARLRVTVLPGGDPTGRARIVARAWTDREARDSPHSEELVDGRTWLEVELPAADGGVTLELENTAGGVLALLAEQGVELWRRGGRERHASLAVALHAGLALACASSLAFAFATWIGSATAAATALALWLAWTTFAAAELAPRLPRALRFVGEGRLPETVGMGSLLLTLALLLLARAVSLRGLRSWRYAP